MAMEAPFRRPHRRYQFSNSYDQYSAHLVSDKDRGISNSTHLVSDKDRVISYFNDLYSAHLVSDKDRAFLLDKSCDLSSFANSGTQVQHCACMFRIAPVRWPGLLVEFSAPRFILIDRCRVLQSGILLFAIRDKSRLVKSFGPDGTPM